MAPRNRSNRDQTASDFFIQFPDFTPNPVATLTDDFHRLADHRGWTRNSKRWRKMWNQLANLEYDRLIGSTLVSLNSWRGFCIEVGLEGGYPSITKCKAALSQVFVNIIDLLDSRRAGTQVRTFRSRRKLAQYTKSQEKFFSRDEAKQDGLLRVLLRHIIS